MTRLYRLVQLLVRKSRQVEGSHEPKGLLEVLRATRSGSLEPRESFVGVTGGKLCFAERGPDGQVVGIDVSVELDAFGG